MPIFQARDPKASIFPSTGMFGALMEGAGQTLPTGILQGYKQYIQNRQVDVDERRATALERDVGVREKAEQRLDKTRTFSEKATIAAMDPNMQVFMDPATKPRGYTVDEWNTITSSNMKTLGFATTLSTFDKDLAPQDLMDGDPTTGYVSINYDKVPVPDDMQAMVSSLVGLGMDEATVKEGLLELQLEDKLELNDAQKENLVSQAELNRARAKYWNVKLDFLEKTGGVNAPTIKNIRTNMEKAALAASAAHAKGADLLDLQIDTKFWPGGQGTIPLDPETFTAMMGLSNSRDLPTVMNELAPFLASRLAEAGMKLTDDLKRKIKLGTFTADDFKDLGGKLRVTGEDGTESAITGDRMLSEIASRVLDARLFKAAESSFLMEGAFRHGNLQLASLVIAAYGGADIEKLLQGGAGALGNLGGVGGVEEETVVPGQGSVLQLPDPLTPDFRDAALKRIGSLERLIQDQNPDVDFLEDERVE